MRTTMLFASILAAVGLVAVLPLGAFGLGGPIGAGALGPAADAADEGATTTGERFAGTVGIEAAELEGDLETRRFSVRLSAASDDAAKVEAIDDELDDAEARLDALEERRTSLREARESGDISEGKYRAEIARLNVELRAVERAVVAADRFANQLSGDLTAQGGLTAQETTAAPANRATTLRERASEIRDREVAEIAREMGGEAAETKPDPETGLEATSNGGPANAADGGPGASPNGSSGAGDAPGQRNGAQGGGSDGQPGQDAVSDGSPDSGVGDAPAAVSNATPERNATPEQNATSERNATTANTTAADGQDDAGEAPQSASQAVDHAASELEDARNAAGSAEAVPPAAAEALDSAATELDAAEEALEAGNDDEARERAAASSEASNEAARVLVEQSDEIDAENGTDAQTLG
ncbi:DUF7096 domain-containing protein [Haloferacaceae archaeon DSL9]